jgi:hypothetical protein
MIYPGNKNSRVNLFLIGEQKCGTSSLHELLIRNKKILSGVNKECQYFNTEKYNKDSGYKDYHAMFTPSLFRKYDFKIDGTPDYLHTPEVAKRVYEYNPDGKLIVVLRDPVSRFVSAYNFYFSNILKNLDSIYKRYFQYSEKGREIHSYIKERGELSLAAFFEEELSGRSPIKALQRGNYYSNLKEWLSYFPESSLRILFFEYLKDPSSLQGELRILESFLSLDLEGDFPRENVSLKKDKLDAKLNEELYSYYNNESNLLTQLVDRPVPWLK